VQNARFALRSTINIEKQPCICYARTMHECTMNYNLLQKTYDIQCELFIKGFIDYEDFLNLEREYLYRINLFTINLN